MDEPYTDSLNNPKVNKTRGIKYAILEQVIKDNLKDGDNIIELFAGAGINTGFVLEYCKPGSLYLADISEDCYKVLLDKFFKIKNVTIYQGNSFEIFPDMEDCDFLFLDSAFKFSVKDRFETLFKYLSELNNDKIKICFTESETYKFTFIKKELVAEKRQAHFNKLINMFQNMGWYTEKLYYCSSNAYLVLIHNEENFGEDGEVQETEFIEYTKGSDKWCKYAYGETKNLI